MKESHTCTVKQIGYMTLILINWGALNHIVHLVHPSYIVMPWNYSTVYCLSAFIILTNN